MKPRLLDLRGGRQTIVDEVDQPLVANLALYLTSNGYVAFSMERRVHLLHRFLLGYLPGHVDHRNGDKLDNRRSNLRAVSPQVNQANRKRLNRNNTSGIRGVQYAPRVSATKPWRAQIMVSGRGLHLGLFADRDSAVAARRAAELEHFGELCP